MSTNQDDRIGPMLDDLSRPVPSADRVQRTRLRCHAVLAQRRNRQTSLEQKRPVGGRFVDAIVLLVLGVYLAGAVSEAVWLGSSF
jgi:hypothetical protein